MSGIKFDPNEEGGLELARAIVGTDRSTEFARQMRSEGFTRFEEVIDDFRDRFNDSWIRSQDVANGKVI